MPDDPASFAAVCERYGFRSEDYNRQFFNANGVEYRLVGFERGRSDYVIRARRVHDSEIVLFTRAVAAHYIERKWSRPNPPTP